MHVLQAHAQFFLKPDCAQFSFGYLEPIEYQIHPTENSQMLYLVGKNIFYSLLDVNGLTCG